MVLFGEFFLEHPWISFSFLSRKIEKKLLRSNSRQERISSFYISFTYNKHYFYHFSFLSCNSSENRSSDPKLSYDTTGTNDWSWMKMQECGYHASLERFQPLHTSQLLNKTRNNHNPGSRANSPRPRTLDSFRLRSRQESGRKS